MKQQRIGIYPAEVRASMDADMRQIEATMSEARARWAEQEAARAARRAERIAPKKPLKGMLARRKENDDFFT